MDLHSSVTDAVSAAITSVITARASAAFAISSTRTARSWPGWRRSVITDVPTNALHGTYVSAGDKKELDLDVH